MKDYIKQEKNKRLKGYLLSIIFILLVFIVLILMYYIYFSLDINEVKSVEKSSNIGITEKQAEEKQKYRQMDLFTDYSDLKKKEEEENARLDRERRLGQAMLSIKKRYGKNAILKGTSLEEGATAMERNGQIGGHKA